MKEKELAKMALEFAKHIKTPEDLCIGLACLVKLSSNIFPEL